MHADVLRRIDDGNLRMVMGENVAYIIIPDDRVRYEIAL